MSIAFYHGNRKITIAEPIPGTVALGRVRQNCEFKASLDYIDPRENIKPKQNYLLI